MFAVLVCAVSMSFVLNHGGREDTEERVVMLINEQVTGRLLGAAFAVHTELGPGLLESVYVACLLRELREAEIAVEAEVKLPVVYKGATLDMGFRLDLLVGGSVVVEVKAVQRILPSTGRS